MSTKRTVTINIDAEKQVDMKIATDGIAWCEALGYLATWGPKYPRVEIFDDGETDMYAIYYDMSGKRAYFIAAIWHGDHYGFHS